MQIEAITLREIQMPLVHFFETSFGRTYSRRILLVTVHCEGAKGWGECVAGEDPFYSSEWIDSVWPTMVQYLAPAVMGQSWESARECVSFFAKERGHRMAKAAMENAGRNAPRDCVRCFDLYSGFRRAIAGKDPDRSRGRIPPHQGQS